ncbi:hypothetical protein ACI7YW_10145 [Clostridium ljungdahlii]|uniref:hypothetical protein n=1 Tax=Clostridium ljungdahlii TaxID=1538 RepID=UPI00386D9840
MEKLSIKTSLDNIIVTTGSQQALDLSGKVFIDEGDTIICESPTYLAAIVLLKPIFQTLKNSYGQRRMTIEM